MTTACVGRSASLYMPWGCGTHSQAQPHFALCRPRGPLCPLEVMQGVLLPWVWILMSFTWSHPGGLGLGSSRCGTQEGIEPVPAHVAPPCRLEGLGTAGCRGKGTLTWGLSGLGSCSAGNGRLVPPTASAGQDDSAPVPFQSGPARFRHAPVAAGDRPQQPNLQPSLCSYRSAESAALRTHPLPTPIPLLGGTLTSRVPTLRVPPVPRSHLQPCPGALRPPEETHGAEPGGRNDPAMAPAPREAAGLEQEPGRKRAPVRPVPRQSPKGNSLRSGEPAAPRGRQPVRAAGSVT